MTNLVSTKIAETILVLDLLVGCETDLLSSFLVMQPVIIT